MAPKRRMAAGRKGIDIKGEHAVSRTLPEDEMRRLGFGAKKALVMRTAKHRNAPTYSLAHGIADLLYPGKFPRIIAQSRDGSITYSKRISLDEESSKGIDGYYADRRNYGKNSPEFQQHDKRVKARAEEEVARIGAESGIFANSITMNVGVRSNELIFFEVGGIRLPTLIKRIERMPERTEKERMRKKEAMELLKGLEKYSEGKELIYTHF